MQNDVIMHQTMCPIKIKYSFFVHWNKCCVTNFYRRDLDIITLNHCAVAIGEMKCWAKDKLSRFTETLKDAGLEVFQGLICPCFLYSAQLFFADNSNFMEPKIKSFALQLSTIYWCLYPVLYTTNNGNNYCLTGV